MGRDQDGSAAQNFQRPIAEMTPPWRLFRGPSDAR
jgi:hypothetical protein